QPGGLGPVVEDVAEVRIAGRAQHFGAAHGVTRVCLLADILAGDRRVEAGPTTAGVELRVGLGKRRTTAYAAIHACLLSLPVLAADRSVGAFLPRVVDLLRAGLLLPFRIGLSDLVDHVFFSCMGNPIWGRTSVGVGSRGPCSGTRKPMRYHRSLA